MQNERIDIHEFDKRLNYTLRLVQQQLPDYQQQPILKYKDDMLARGLTLARIEKVVFLLKQFAKESDKPLEEITKDDMKKIIAKFEQRKDLSDWYRHDLKVVIKKFYQWLRGIDEKKVYPDEVKWIETTVRNVKTKIPEELLSEDDIQKLAEVTDHPRDKALVLTLYESGTRISELMGMRMRHVKFDNYGAVCIVWGKTGARRVRLIASAPALANWLSHHPERNNPEAPIWIGIGTKKELTKPILYFSVYTRLKELFKRADIKKKFNPHLFRHSRATHLAKHLTEAQMKEMFGWKQNSQMAGVYVHLSGRDVDKALLKMYNLVEETEEDGKKFDVVICPRCKLKNSSSKFCSHCGMVLSMETALKLAEVEKARDEVMTNPKYKELFFEFLEFLKKEKK